MTEPFKTVVADPPWFLRRGAGWKSGVNDNYQTLTREQIVDVMRSADVWHVADQAHLWLWVTNNHLPNGLWVMEQLGFRYITNVCWVKPRMGVGRYVRGRHELCLLGVRGDRAMLPADRGVPSTVAAPTRAHSQKPDEAFTLIQRVSPGPYLEMFARAPREGWTVWGDEVA